MGPAGGYDWRIKKEKEIERFIFLGEYKMAKLFELGLCHFVCLAIAILDRNKNSAQFNIVRKISLKNFSYSFST